MYNLCLFFLKNASGTTFRPVYTYVKYAIIYVMKPLDEHDDAEKTRRDEAASRPAAGFRRLSRAKTFDGEIVFDPRIEELERHVRGTMGEIPCEIRDNDVEGENPPGENEKDETVDDGVLEDSGDLEDVRRPSEN